MQSVYELRQIRSSSDRNITKALNVYSKNIDPLIRTDTREILYWIDRYNQQFSDRFYIVALYLNEVVIGYAQFAYFREEKLVFIDYVAIEKENRKNNTFYEFIEKIKDFFIEEGIEYNYIVTEVGYYKENKEPTEVTKNLIRLLKMTGFGVVKMTYYQPMLGKLNYETELSTVLMLYTANEVKRIKIETFLLIIDTIYYKHYKRWYDRFLNEKEQVEYVSRLKELKSRIEQNLHKRDHIEINGYANLYTTNLPAKESSKYVRLAKILGVCAVFIALSIAVGSGVLFVKKKYDLDQDAIKFIAFFSLATVVFFTTLFYRSKNESIYSAIEKVIKIFK